MGRDRNRRAKRFGLAVFVTCECRAGGVSNVPRRAWF